MKHMSKSGNHLPPEATKSPRPLLVIGGPTATGKTEAAVQLAEALEGEIVSADSMQIYRRLDIGTAKPTADERARAVFHLVDCVEPTEVYTVADFQRDARCALAEIHARGHLPILCGGTGLYLRALLGGLSFPPGGEEATGEVRRRLEDEAETLGAAALHQRLKEVDPPTATRLPVGDVRRVIRALEVYEVSGRPFSDLARVDGAGLVNYNAATFFLTCPREMLYSRIEERIDRMLAQGWLQEVAALQTQGLTLEHQSMQAIGYRHLLGYLEAGGDLTAVVAGIKQDTRRYAKRQLTWLRRETGTWLEWKSLADFAEVVECMRQSGEHLLAGDD